MNFDEYELSRNPGVSSSSSGSGSLLDDLPKLCYDEHCCSKGLIYDKHIGKCVIPRKNKQHHNKKHS